MKEVVEALETLLERARAGELCSIAYTCGTGGRSRITGWAGDTGPEFLQMVNVDTGRRTTVERPPT